MNAHHLDQALRCIHQISVTAESDNCLLQRFAEQRDEGAFETLVRRHGPMVQGVCRRILHDHHAAEDAFQETFRDLAKVAAFWGRVQSLGGWLHDVAFRAACSARKRAGRKDRVEQPLGEREVPDSAIGPADAAAQHDLRQVLDAKVEGLPKKYREVVVLCYLQGKTYEQAAEALRITKINVGVRLKRARERLREQLVRRGETLTSGSLALVLSQNAASAAVPAGLVQATVRAAVLCASAESAVAGAVISASIWGLVAALVVSSGLGVALYGRADHQTRPQDGREQRAIGHEKSDSSQEVDKFDRAALPSPSEPVVNIRSEISIPRPGDKVKERFVAQGSLAQDVPGRYVWVGVLQNGLWYPKADVTAHKGKAWTAEIMQPAGHFNLVLLAVSSEHDQATIAKWIDPRRSEFPGLGQKHLPSTVELEQVRFLEAVVTGP